jgi:hypothetical protein
MSLKFCKSARASRAIEASWRGAVAIVGIVCSLICIHVLKVGIISRIHIAAGGLLALRWGAVAEFRSVHGHDQKEKLTPSSECSLGVGKSGRIETVVRGVRSFAKCWRAAKILIDMGVT